MHDTIDLHRVIGALHQARAALQLDTAQLLYLITLKVRADRGHLASLSEDDLVDSYLQVCEVIEPDAVNPRKRATHAIQHLRDHRLVRRVDGHGLVRAGDYTLTGLATAIVEFFVADETLTKTSLTVLTSTLKSQLGEILNNARNAVTQDAWEVDVIEPLRVTVSDLVSGIERRQRGMDAQQEDVRERIGSLLQQDWFAAVDDCERLLDETSSTLSELNEVLLRDTAHLQALLQDVEELAVGATVDAAVDQAQRVQEHVDRVASWGGDRQRAWSDYYQFVQRYLRGVVRLDPERAVSQRLRDQLAGWLDAPFAFNLAFEPSIRLLRDEQPSVKRPPVTRPGGDWERAPRLVDPDDAARTLEDAVEDALAAGARTLAEVVAAVLPTVPLARQYRTVGRVASLLARYAALPMPHEKPWTDLNALGLRLEDWSLDDAAGEP